MNKIRIKPDQCFKTLDKDAKGFLKIGDFREFLRRHNFYATEKNLSLMFDRFDKDESTSVEYDEFLVAFTPFLQGTSNI